MDLEPTVTLKAAYLEAMKTCARIVQRYRGRGFELQIVMMAQNRSVMDEPPSTADALYFEDLARWTADLVANTPRSAVEMPRGNRLAASMTHIGVTYLGAAEVYWTGLRRGVLQKPPR